MKYQIQVYSATNEADRQVVAESEELGTQDEIQAFWATKTFGYSVPEGKKLALVPAEHFWFKTQANDGITPGPNLIPSQSSSADIDVTKEVPTEQVLTIEKELAKARMFEREERERKLAEYMANFPG